MIFESLSNIEFIDVIIISCHLLVIGVLIITGILFYGKSRGKASNIKKYLKGIILFMLIYSVSRLVMFIFELTFDPFIWQLTPTETEIALTYDPNLNFRYSIFWYTGTILGAIAFFIILFDLETFILLKKTKYIPSAFLAIIYILGLSLGAVGAEQITLGKFFLSISAIFPLLIPITYFFFAYKSSGDTRRRAIGAGIGFTIFFLGIGLNSTMGKAIFIFLLSPEEIVGVYASYIMYAVLAIIGLIIFLKSIHYE
ncbi:MAG: hypothetical protein R6U96_10090 [Promethearchaeia archaeon]